MNSTEYWKKREAENLVRELKEEKAYEKELDRIYKDMLDGCKKEIESFYSRYADKEGITIAEAKKRVSKLDIEAYERKAKRYVKDKDFSKEANEEMRLYNLTMKVNRLEMLKANIGLELIKGHEELNTFMGKILKGRTEDELKRQAGILGKTVRNNAKLAEAIVNGSHENATFSQRIWGYQGQLRSDLSKLLEQGLIQGKNARVLAKELNKYFIGNEKKVGGAKYNAERLMRTELARVQTEAQKQSFIANGFKEYTFIVNAGCCDICAGIAGKHFKVAKMMPGENAPPMHPFCRCSIAAYEDSEEYEAWLDFLDKGGTTEEWNKQKNKINAPINARNTATGRPTAIAQHGVQLSKQQRALLDKLDGYDSRVIVDKRSADMTDLAALTAETGDEFAMFTRGSERLIVRGNSSSVNIDIDNARELAQNGYKWSGHTHPGHDYNCLIASDGDYAILEAFGQTTGVTYNSLGQYLTFELE